MWNLWTDAGCVFLMPKHLCVWETPSWLLAYTFYLFSLTEVRLRICMSIVCISGLALLYRRICAFYVLFLVIRMISSPPNKFLSTNGGLLLIFTWTCFSNLLYFISAYILSSLLLNDHQYIICLVTSRMLHSPILNGIVM
jgi:hypothetical protein